MYVVLLSDNRNVSEHPNQYGYYAGKCFKKEDCVYPLTDTAIVERTKKYSTESRAYVGGIALFNKCTYVLSYSVEEV